MSVSAVQMFYQKLASDMMMRNAFAQETTAATIRFAAERGYMFTAHDLQVAGEHMQGFVKRLGDDMKQIVQHQQQMQKSAKIGIQAGANAGKAASGDANQAMANMQFDLILGRLAEVFNVTSGAKKAK